MSRRIEGDFHDEMLEIYRRAKSEAGYNATRFLRMVAEQGGLKTARYLLHSPRVSAGYAALCERRRLDLTVEATILDPKWESLFSDDDRRVAVSRLREYGFTGPLAEIDPKG